jgi:hypothetical protein
MKDKEKAVPARVVLADWWTLPENKLAEFVAWQDREFLPKLDPARQPCRYRVVAGEHAQVSWYEADPGAAVRGAGALDLPPWLDSQARERFTLDLKADAGDTAGAPAPFRYIVQADIPGELADEYNRWYDEEHLPRLVSVPGIRRARRYTTADNASPFYFTAYDIDSAETWESPPALKARKTPWTERMRGVFVNSRRSMLRREYPA